MRLPISVFIIAKNEEDRISLAIQSVMAWVDEVIVIDSGSTDNTEAVSRELGARVVFNAWQGYGPQKVFGENLCRNDWVLNIDADEVVSPQLAQEIQGLFTKEGAVTTSYAGYRLPVLPRYKFQKKPHPWTIYQYPIRLYHIKKGGFSDSPVHDSVWLNAGEKALKLKHVLFHDSFRSLTHHIEKMNNYSSMQAEDRHRKNKCPHALSLMFVFPLAFFKYYVLRKNFVNGIDGFIISLVNAFWRFLRAVKTREKFLAGKN